MHDLILLQVRMTLQQVVLHLYVSLDIADISLCVTLCLLVVLLDLPLEPVLYPLLQGLKLLLPVLSDPLKLPLQVMRPLLLGIQQSLILCVGVLEVLQLSQILGERLHLLIGLDHVCVLFLAEIL